MTEFMFWLYANYIQPQVEDSLRGPYAYPLESLRSSLCIEEQRRDLDKALEFTAIQAFLLGLRTGEGLAVTRQ